MSLLVDMGPDCTCIDSALVQVMAHEPACQRGSYLDGFRDGFRTGKEEGYHAGGYDAVRSATELNRHLQDTTFRDALAKLLLFVVDAEEAG